jgi:enoyl-CoA hydratase
VAVRIARNGPVTTVTLDRPEVRNAVDRETAAALADAFLAFDADAAARVAVFHGANGTFSAGADLKAIAAGRLNRLDPPAGGRDPNAPMGPTRLALAKPVIAAIAGHAVAGGLELALWCDLRIAEEDAVLGVFSRRFGVPLIDGGTVRLPRIVGHGRALDLILTGRAVGAAEALAMGLVNRVVPKGAARTAAEALAAELAALPQKALLNDRRSAYAQWGLPLDEAMANEFRIGMETLGSGETARGADAFASGAGRGGGSVGSGPDGRK